MNEAGLRCFGYMRMASRGFGLLVWVSLCFLVYSPLAQSQTNNLTNFPKSIVYGGDASFPPYEYIDKQGNPAGFNIELIQKIAQRKGIQVQIKLMPWKKVTEGIQNGKIDVAAMYRSSKRAQVVDFVIPHELVYHEMFIRIGTPPLYSLSDLIGKRVVVEGGTLSDDILSELGLETNLIRAGSEPDALRLLAQGRGDVALVTQTVGRPFQERTGIAGISVTGPPVLLSEYAFVTRKGQRMLVEALNEGVMAVRASGEYEALYDKWLRPDRSAARLRIIGWVFGGTLVITLLVLAWNRTLRRVVERQTQSIRESEERLRRAIVEAPFPVMLHAEGGAVLLVSRALCEITGYKAEEIPTTAEWAKRVYGEELPLVQEGLDRLYSLDHRVEEGDYRVLTKAGDVRIWNFSSAPMGRLPDGRRLVISMAMDVTDRRIAENEIRRLNAGLEQRVAERTSELQAVNRELESFSYSVSHDLRSPLRGIDGWTKALKEDFGDRLGEAGCQMLDRVQSNAQRMSSLIDDLLWLARLTRQPLIRQKVCVEELVKWVWRDLLSRESGGRTNIELIVGSLPDCEADESLITQVFVNLLSNAMKFTGKQAEPRIEVGCQPGQDGEWIYFVRDNGVGFDPEQANKLFTPFQRLHSTSEFPGTGIGLAIVQRVIQRHGGRIWAEGAIGKGACFHFTVPKQEPSPAVPTSAN